VTLSGRDISELLAAHGLHPSRALGQNFVVDPNTVRRVARLAEVGAGDHVVEIGAGLGSLTLALVETGAEVTAIEVDRGLVPVLRSVVEPSGVRVIEADALKADWPAILGSDRWVLVANLPYNVATPLIADLLDGVPQIHRMLVMVQREVGERLAASAGDEAYGAVSVKIAYWARAEIVGRVPPTVFLPKPKVESALVRIVRREVPAVGSDVDPDWLFTLVRAGFGHRRKMLRGSLQGVATVEQIEAAGIAPTARAEELDIAAWGRLAREAAPRG
jgi:16S rRNA (adenine1518-N6/adenine1519-N6)-dimethyltransferase